jgi:probable rRNA maturation factor
MEIEMSYQNDTELKKYDEEYFEKVARVIFEHLKLDCYFIFEVNIVDTNTIHQINREYRNIDRPTDVISFAFEDDFEGENKIILSNDLPRDLGEIFICDNAAISQAKEYGHSLDREITFLFTHGLLHLLGYDHMKVEDEKIMFKLQDEIMSKLGL